MHYPEGLFVNKWVFLKAFLQKQQVPGPSMACAVLLVLSSAKYLLRRCRAHDAAAVAAEPCVAGDGALVSV